MYYPSLKEARELAASGGCRYVPVSRELFSDFITPIQALRILRAKSGHCFLLESAADSAGWGRYTFLGFDPTLEVTCKDGILQLRDRDTVRTELQHPAPILRKLLAEHKCFVMQTRMTEFEIPEDREQRAGIAEFLVCVWIIRALVNRDFGVRFLERIIEKSDMAHDPQAVGQQPCLLRIAKMAVNVLLFHRRTGGGAVGEQTVNCPVWGGIRICFCHELRLPQL